MWRIERDFFNAARGHPDGQQENGIALRDMVRLRSCDGRPGFTIVAA